MTPRNSLLVGQIALEQNLLTREQLQQCLDLQAGQVQPKPIGALLVETGFLTPAKLAELIEEQGRRMREASPYVPAEKEAVSFGRLVVKHGHATREHVNEALRAQQDLADRGIRKRLGELLVEAGHLDAAVVPRVLRMQGKTLMACTFCGTHFNVLSAIADGYPCRKCNMPLAEQTVTISALESAYLLPAVDPRALAPKPEPVPAAPPPVDPRSAGDEELRGVWKRMIVVATVITVLGLAIYFLTRAPK